MLRIIADPPKGIFIYLRSPPPPSIERPLNTISTYVEYQA
jgi:hypothetical protein